MGQRPRQPGCSVTVLVSLSALPPEPGSQFCDQRVWSCEQMPRLCTRALPNRIPTFLATHVRLEHPRSARRKACEPLTSFKTTQTSSPKWVPSCGGPRNDVPALGFMRSYLAYRNPAKIWSVKRILNFCILPIIFRRSATLHTTLHPFRRPSGQAASSLLHGRFHAPRPPQRGTLTKLSDHARLPNFLPAASSDSDRPLLSPPEHPYQDTPQDSDQHIARHSSRLQGHGRSPDCAGTRRELGERWSQV